MIPLKKIKKCQNLLIKICFALLISRIMSELSEHNFLARYKKPLITDDLYCTGASPLAFMHAPTSVGFR